MRRRTLRTLFVVSLVAVAAAALPGSAAAASDATITAEPDAGTATATHNVTVTVGEAGAGNLTNVTVDYSGSGADLTGVTFTSVTAGIDRGDDANGTATDVDVTPNVTSVSSGFDGATLTVQFDGGPNVQAGDELVLSVSGVENPEQGEYAVPVSVAGGPAANATLTTTEATPSPTPTATPTVSPTGTDGDDPAGGTDTGGQPGFGALAAVAALAGAALLVRRTD